MARTGQMMSPTNAGALEMSLDGVIEKLSTAEATPHTRALLIEARRLRSIISNWRSIPPLPQVRDEMVARVLHVSAAAGQALPGAPASRPSQSYGQSHQAQLIHAAHAAQAALAQPRVDEWGPPSEGFSGEVTVITDGTKTLPETPLNVVPAKPPESPDPHLVMFTDPYGISADRYRALRHRLSASGDPRIIAVTSAGRSEGKSVCAVNLAMALREGARGRVLLMEANLRAPGLAALLGFLPPECLSEQLARHKADPQAAWTPVEQVAPLHVLAVDPTTKKSPLLDPIAFSIAIDRLRLAGYDYIVVDTPPILESADVNLIADSVDGILIVARAKRSRARAIRAAIEQLGPTTVLGTVLLDTD